MDGLASLQYNVLGTEFNKAKEDFSLETRGYQCLKILVNGNDFRKINILRQGPQVSV